MEGEHIMGLTRDIYFETKENFLDIGLRILTELPDGLWITKIGLITNENKHITFLPDDTRIRKSYNPKMHFPQLKELKDYLKPDFLNLHFSISETREIGMLGSFALTFRSDQKIIRMFTESTRINKPWKDLLKTIKIVSKWVKPIAIYSCTCGFEEIEQIKKQHRSNDFEVDDKEARIILNLRDQIEKIVDKYKND